MIATSTTASRYARPWACTHRHFARLVNGEVGCLGCMHVVVRRNGSAVAYLIPSQVKALEVLAERADEAAA